MPDANTIKTQQQESIVGQHLHVLASELLKGRDGAAVRMVHHPVLGLVTAAEAKFARQHGWDADTRRY
jgi:hypothetical protein